MKKTIMFAMLLTATSASAQYVHIELKNGEVYDYDSKDIKSLTVDSEAPNPAPLQPGEKVQGTVAIGDKTYTKTVGGTVGNAVDLGLPSKTLWADHNIGATNPEDYGAYLAWAEVGAEEEGYTNGVKSNYAWSITKYSNGTYNSWSKYVATSSYGTVDDGMALYPKDDAATVNWGGDWRMPTCDEQAELRTKCTWTWVTTGVKDAYGNYIEGYKVVGPNGNSIFLPAAGWRNDGSCERVGSHGYYWSSSLHTNYGFNAYVLRFGTADVYDGNSGRFLGHGVRPVCCVEIN